MRRAASEKEEEEEQGGARWKREFDGERTAGPGSREYSEWK